MNRSSATVTEQELHAFVDAQLDPDRLSAVLAWLETHPEDAARVQQWQALCRQLRRLFHALDAGPVSPSLTCMVLHAALPAPHEDRQHPRSPISLTGTHR